MWTLMAYAENSGTGAASGGMWEFILMMAVIFSIFYFILIRPEKKKRHDHEKRINQLKKGDRIITAGGIYGKIVGMKENAAVVQIAENVKVEILKSSISTIVEDEK